jgi:superfamily II DNA helicase RecQ
LQEEPGIIYCQTILTAEKLYEELSPQLKVGLFHSKLSEHRRLEVYHKWISGKIRTIVATICFGMGINKKDIRYVINVGISKSPENYYQESGRAGRDGRLSHCIIVSHPKEMASIQFLIHKSNLDAKHKAHQLYKLQQIRQYAEEEI